ncbi:MAG: hypothetical protein F6K30_07595 [Cyanothece sp. SIO2G6]|nr:hypothetical protein [Cyanothece sp. SIO2G6]
MTNGETTDTARLKIEIEGTTDPTDPPPVANDDVFSPVKEGQPFKIEFSRLLLNDENPAGADDLLKIESIVLDNPSAGNLNVDYASGSLIFKPAPFFTKEIGFNYTLSNGRDVDTAKVTIPIQDTEPTIFRESEFNNRINVADEVTISDANYDDAYGVNINPYVFDDSKPHLRIEGRLGREDGQAEADVFKFEFDEGDTVTFDIDAGFRYAYETGQNLGDVLTNPLPRSNANADTRLFLLDGDRNLSVKQFEHSNSEDAGSFVNTNTGIFRDPLILNYRIPEGKGGIYYLGVTTEDARWNRNAGPNGGGRFVEIDNPSENGFSGDYVLFVSVDPAPILLS